MKRNRVLIPILRESGRVNRLPRSSNQPVRDFPTYTIPEAALYLGMPSRTLRYWVSGKPVWSVADSCHHIPLLSFQDLAQAYYIETVRKHFHTSLRATREAMESARKESRRKYPLLGPGIKNFLGHIVMDKPARGRQPRRVIDLSGHRNFVIAEFVDQLATRVNRNSKGDLIRIFPWRFWHPGDESKPVAIDPEVMSGRLVITGTRIPVQTILQRKEAGESEPALARDYLVPLETITQALRHLVPKAA